MDRLDNHQSIPQVMSPVSGSSGGGSSSAISQRFASQIHRAISPPTPAPSPQPGTHRLPLPPSAALVDEDASFGTTLLQRHVQEEYRSMSAKERQAFLAHIVDICSARELAHLSTLISPRLKVDFLSALPIEVSLTILSHFDDPRTLARASCVSRFWRSLVNDEQTWKVMCKRYRFRQVPLPKSWQRYLRTLEPPHFQNYATIYALPVKQEPQDDSMELLSTDLEPAPPEQPQQQQEETGQASNTSIESHKVLGNLYDTYRARGLDPETALSELKALHELFLSKRAREMGVEERRRQLHALQNDNVFTDMMQDKTFAERIAGTSMSEDDKRFYGQLEEFVRERAEGSSSAVDGRPSSSSWATTSASMNDVTSPTMREATAVGLLSTGPPSTRTMRGPLAAADALADDPRTPTVPQTHATRSAAGAALPLRDVERTIVSPTSRLGSMTSGLLTSLWDRTAGGSTLDVPEAQQVPSQPPSSGDHGHSAQGHRDDGEEEWAGGVSGRDAEMQGDARGQALSDGMQLDDNTEERAGLPSSSSTTSTEQTATTSREPTRYQLRKASRRFAPFARPGEEASSSATADLGLGRPSLPDDQSGSRAFRSATSQAGSPASFEQRAARSTVAASDDSAATKRAASMGQPSMTRSSSSTSTTAQGDAPFSYRTHFKLAYQTESNWLRGGRMLTQHESSDDASGDGATVTSLSIDDQWIVVGMANAKIHAFDAKTGLFVRTLTGHSTGVWCLELISATDNVDTLRAKNGKSRAEEEQPESTTVYALSPDLDLVHHDPRPAATVFTPDVQYDARTDTDGLFSMPEPLHQAGQQRGIQRSSHNTLNAGRVTPRAEPVHADPNAGSSALSAPPPPRAAVEAANTARAGAGHHGNRSYSTRGAGLGSNFGSACGSVAGFGNPTALVVSSGCDRDVRVWDLSTGECLYKLRGHRSTVRCLRVFEGRPIAVSGSRDGTIRVWNVRKGRLVFLLPGHQHSVRCLDLAGNLIASASYDCTARIWNADTGECLHVLRGHYHQLYAVAFDGVRVATGSLDTSVRIWSAETGECLALLQGHTSLVGQLQLTDSTLVTGGSDGKVMVFSLKTMKQLYQLSAHDNSVTCLQFDDRFIVTGGNDGKVKLWNFRTGEYVRDLCKSSDQVWKVSFRDDKCVVLCKRGAKTGMDVISFRPVAEGF